MQPAIHSSSKSCRYGRSLGVTPCRQLLFTQQLAALATELNSIVRHTLLLLNALCLYHA